MAFLPNSESLPNRKQRRAAKAAHRKLLSKQYAAIKGRRDGLSSSMLQELFGQSNTFAGVDLKRDRINAVKAGRSSKTSRNLQQMFAETEELAWLSTRSGEFMSRFRGQHSNGVRLAYETELDPGAIDAGTWCPYDRGGAQAYDDASW